MTEMREFAKIVSKAWADPAFAERLRADPVEVFKSEGIDVPERTKVVDLSTEPQADFYFVVPRKPKSLDEGIVDLVSQQLKEILFVCFPCCVPEPRE